MFLFQLANAAALPTMAGRLARRLPETATLILSVCIFALTVRCASFAATSEPALVIAVQLLDGVSAARLVCCFPSSSPT